MDKKKEHISVPHFSDHHEIEFALAQIVTLKSNPSRYGPIIDVLPGRPENRYRVFLDGTPQTLFASQLKARVEQEDRFQSLSSDHFHAYLTALQIRYPGLSTLYSLNAARVDFIPYQFRPVLRFIRSDRPRMLIADGVGVGKTIEAGLILRELQARRDIRSVLIVCPRPLVTEKKWQRELKRFEERFTHLDGKLLSLCINEMDLDGEWPDMYRKVILPFSLFDDTLLHGSTSDANRGERIGLLDLEPPPRFDLVIVDEAHHIRNPDSYRHKAVKFFCDHAEAVIFLTATPIQLGSKDLFVLLNTLRPDLIIDQESFAHMAEPNPFINQAISAIRSNTLDWQHHALEALNRAVSTPWGQSILKHNPEFERMHADLQQKGLSDVHRVRLISTLEEMHTFSGIINRTRRRDIGNFTIRKPETIVVPFTEDQKLVHDELLSIQAEIFRQIHNGVNVKFMMTTIRRQAASSLFGLVPFLSEILNRHVDELSWGEADDSDLPSIDAIQPIRTQIESLLQLAGSLDPADPKLEALRSIIQEKQMLPNNKIMVFSSFRHTLQYLYINLKKDGFRVGLVHGGTPDEDRMRMRARFEQERGQHDTIDLMLFSEVGCEGLDYQFCDCIVNYDLPWNPMRVEQRIGRIDRKGQKSETIAIVNLITPDTVDADIYERCLLRIGVFNNALGAGEDILGDITKEIRSIADNYRLSDEDRKLKLQQLADNKIRLIQEQEALEQKQAELFGIRLPQEQINREIQDASSYWLTPDSLQRMVTLYLQNACGKDHEFILGEKSLKTLRVGQESRVILMQDFKLLPKDNNSVYRRWEQWLKGGTQHLTITFDSECAIRNPDAAFIMPLHPLVKQAAMSFDVDDRILTDLTVTSMKVPAGRYEFAIYQWQYHGIREDLVFKPIAADSSVTKHLGMLLQYATDSEIERSDPLSESIREALDHHHYTIWNDERQEHRRKTRELVEYRRESLSTSHNARISMLEEQLEQATNPKIHKMRHSQLSAAQADYHRRLAELNTAEEGADIITSPVVYGWLNVVEGYSNAD